MSSLLDKKKYIIEIEMADAGRIFRDDQAEDFVVKHLVRKEEAAARDRVRGLLCPIHHNFPEVISTINDQDLIVIHVKTCCMIFNDIVDKRFSGGK